MAKARDSTIKAAEEIWEEVGALPELSDKGCVSLPTVQDIGGGKDVL
jgi:hypothetical protein